MFKIAKYYFLFNWLQKAKRNMIGLMVSVVIFVMAIYLFSDLIAMAESKSGLVLVKWIVLLFLLTVIAFNMVQIFKSFRIPFIEVNSSNTVDFRKDQIISKEHLMSKSDRILDKYRDNA